MVPLKHSGTLISLLIPVIFLFSFAMSLIDQRFENSSQINECPYADAVCGQAYRARKLLVFGFTQYLSKPASADRSHAKMPQAKESRGVALIQVELFVQWRGDQEFLWLWQPLARIRAARLVYKVRIVCHHCLLLAAGGLETWAAWDCGDTYYEHRVPLPWPRAFGTAFRPSMPWFDSTGRNRTSAI
jgi:hypothetical protein